MKNVDSKKLAGTIIGGLAFIFSIIFFTFAWYEWRSGNTILGGEIIDLTNIDITLENDGDITSTNIGPVLNPEDGVVAGFTADNKGTAVHLYIDLKINSIDSELLAENFKYLIVKSTVSPRTDEEIDKSTLTYDYDNPVASGDFSNFTVSTNSLGEDNVKSLTITFYKIFIYLDGTTETDINQQGKSIDATLTITDTRITKLSEVPVGSYVEYVGNNGCEGDSCSGINANYESGVSNGWCVGSSNEFNSSGWRIAYVDEEGSAYLVSAGAPECMCTNSDGTTSSESCDTSIESSDDIQLHLDNLNEVALKYCNTEYAKGGVCDNTTAWAMKEADFTKMTNSTLASCTYTTSETCGLNNDLIDNGSYYWYGTPYSASYNGVFDWNPNDRGVSYGYSNGVFGVRPVLYLESSVVVTGGEGTESNPYKIEKLEPEGEIATTYIQNLYNDGSSINTVNIGGDTSKPQVSLNATQGIMLDNNGEYRYYGANPNNYVSFNGELWRIISSSNVKSNETDTTGSQRVRIIRAESIGNHSWDYGTDGSDYDNNWSNATLNTTLNGIYYNGTSGTCYYEYDEQPCDYSGNGTVKGLSSEARALIDDAVWYLGGNSTASGLYADDWYTVERNNAGYGSNPTTWTGKVGIMYPSDYTYAADLSLCTMYGFNYEDGDNCAKGDWLFNSDYQWLLSPHSVVSSYAFGVNESGSVNFDDGDYVVVAWGVRPVAVLRSDVTIVEGEGTSENPYTLSVGT